jgi:trk system potassium uptake protein TrkH
MFGRSHPARELASASVRRRWPLSPAQVLVLSFAALILSGTVLLWLPVSAAREPLTIVDALFTATSAVCVTSLIVVDTPHGLTLFGPLVVLFLIQLGGLGYMAITTVAGVALGRQLTVHERLTLQEALNVQTMEGLARFVVTVLKLTLLFEGCGALILTVRWASEYGLTRAAYYGLFHAISAFNNVGFALFSDSLVQFRGDWVVNFVVTSLIICGGLGFVVLTEIGRVRRLRLCTAAFPRSAVFRELFSQSARWRFGLRTASSCRTSSTTSSARGTSAWWRCPRRTPSWAAR